MNFLGGNDANEIRLAVREILVSKDNTCAGVSFTHFQNDKGQLPDFGMTPLKALDQRQLVDTYLRLGGDIDRLSIPREFRLRRISKGAEPGGQQKAWNLFQTWGTLQAFEFKEHKTVKAYFKRNSKASKAYYKWVEANQVGLKDISLLNRDLARTGSSYVSPTPMYPDYANEEIDDLVKRLTKRGDREWLAELRHVDLSRSTNTTLDEGTFKVDKLRARLHALDTTYNLSTNIDETLEDFDVTLDKELTRENVPGVNLEGLTPIKKYPTTPNTDDKGKVYPTTPNTDEVYPTPPSTDDEGTDDESSDTTSNSSNSKEGNIDEATVDFLAKNEGATHDDPNSKERVNLSNIDKAKIDFLAAIEEGATHDAMNSSFPSFVGPQTGRGTSEFEESDEYLPGQDLPVKTTPQGFRPYLGYTPFNGFGYTPFNGFGYTPFNEANTGVEAPEATDGDWRNFDVSRYDDVQDGVQDAQQGPAEAPDMLSGDETEPQTPKPEPEYPAHMLQTPIAQIIPPPEVYHTPISFKKNQAPTHVMNAVGVPAEQRTGRSQQLASIRDKIYQRITELRNENDPIARAYIALESGVRRLMQGKSVSPQMFQDITYLQVLKIALK